ncbi:hypothetical protein LCGC14_2147700 [marine sediment metagenome]|uniref:Uncharacterized protein n=1 Tax=marine sediment metagenome TaxID=412755 RepID=A0A0F9GSQ1_9ZZZZ
MGILLSEEQVGVAMDELMEPPVEETDAVRIARHVAKVQVQTIVRELQDRNGYRTARHGLVLSAKDWEEVAAAADESEEVTAAGGVPSAPAPKVSPELLRKHAGKVLTTREALEAFCYSPATCLRSTVLVTQGILEELGNGRWRVPSAGA